MRIIGEAIRAVLVSLGVLAAAASAKAPGPGETRCVTSYGVTDCKSGPPLAPVQPMPLYVAPVQPQYVVARAPAPPPERVIVTGTKPIYCSVNVAHPTVGSCFLIKESCDETRPRLVADGTAHSECEPRASAACFNAKRILDDARRTICSPSIDDCEYTRSGFLSNVDYAVTQTQCGIYRQVQP